MASVISNGKHRKQAPATPISQATSAGRREFQEQMQRRRDASGKPKPDYRVYIVRRFRTKVGFKPKLVTEGLPERYRKSEIDIYRGPRDRDWAHNEAETHNNTALIRGWKTWAVVEIDHDMLAAEIAAEKLEKKFGKHTIRLSVNRGFLFDDEGAITVRLCGIDGSYDEAIPFDPAKPLGPEVVRLVRARLKQVEAILDEAGIEG